ncbi:3115_t:CDS:2, partial [Ambispora gerdemannii]
SQRDYERVYCETPDLSSTSSISGTARKKKLDTHNGIQVEVSRTVVICKKCFHFGTLTMSDSEYDEISQTESSHVTEQRLEDYISQTESSQTTEQSTQQNIQQSTQQSIRQSTQQKRKRRKTTKTTSKC